MMDSAGAQTSLDNFETAAGTEDDVVERDADVVETDVPVAVGGVVVTEDAKHTVDGYPRRGSWDEDDGLLFVGVCVLRVGFTHDYVDLAARVAGAGGPPFLFHKILSVVVVIRLCWWGGRRVGKGRRTEPLRTHELPSFLIVRLMFLASEEATSGSVMRKADLILPSRRGSSHVRFCFSVPYLAMTSMLPVSGAAQLVAYFN